MQDENRNLRRRLRRQSRAPPARPPQAPMMNPLMMQMMRQQMLSSIMQQQANMMKPGMNMMHPMPQMMMMPHPQMRPQMGGNGAAMMQMMSNMMQNPAMRMMQGNRMAGIMPGIPQPNMSPALMLQDRILRSMHELTLRDGMRQKHIDELQYTQQPFHPMSFTDEGDQYMNRNLRDDRYGEVGRRPNVRDSALPAASPQLSSFLPTILAGLVAAYLFLVLI